MVRHGVTSDLASTACSQRPSRQAAQAEGLCINNPVKDSEVAMEDVSGAGRTASLLLAAVAAAALM